MTTPAPSRTPSLLERAAEIYDFSSGLRVEPKPGPAPAQGKGADVMGTVTDILGSPAVKSMMRSAASTAGREIMRSLFGVGRRR